MNLQRGLLVGIVAGVISSVAILDTEDVFYVGYIWNHANMHVHIPVMSKSPSFFDNLVRFQYIVETLRLS